MGLMSSRSFCLLAAVAVSGAVLAEDGDVELVKGEADNAWHFSIGPVVAPRVRVKIGTTRPIMPSLPKSGSSSTMSGGSMPAPPSEGYTDREYVDGYVKPDEGTEDPDSMIPGLTWDWGADNVGAQYSGGRMEFHSEMSRMSESVSASSYSEGSFSDSDRDTMLGVEAIGGWSFHENEVFEAAIDGGFRFYGTGDLDAESRYGATVTTMRNEYRLVDTYDASGWTEVPRGPHEGSAGGPGPVIGALPTRREELMGSSGSTETYYYHTNTKLEYRIWDLRLGPTLGWKATDYLTIRGGVYGLLGIVDAKLRTSSGSSAVSRSSRCSRSECVFGVAAGLSAQFNITENIFLVGGAEYDWWADTIDLNAAGSDARIELSDVTISLAVGLEF